MIPRQIEIKIRQAAKQYPVMEDIGQKILSMPELEKGLNYWKKLVKNPSVQSALIYAGKRSFHHKSTAVYSWWNF